MKYFKRTEFDCSHTGLNEMDMAFLLRLDRLRERCNFPFTITSGYRDITHPVEAKKEKGGQHTLGVACDIKVSSGAMKYTLIKEAMAMGFKGIGIADTFIHIDDRLGVPVVWSY